MKPACILALAMAATPAMGQPPACEFFRQGPPPQRVELYTSEGCSSCPPADRWLSSLPPRPEQLLLAFHVDYWDDLGWPDRYADARFSARQRDTAARAGSRTLYTPQVVLEGRDYRGWQHSLAAPAASDGPAITVRIRVDDAVHAELLAGPGLDQRARVHLALTENARYSEVRGGENRGARLRHDHVVRAFAGPQAASGALSLKLPHDIDPAQAQLLLWLEDDAGRTLQGLSVPLASCRARSATR